MKKKILFATCILTHLCMMGQSVNVNDIEKDSVYVVQNDSLEISTVYYFNGKYTQEVYTQSIEDGSTIDFVHSYSDTSLNYDCYSVNNNCVDCNQFLYFDKNGKHIYVTNICFSNIFPQKGAVDFKKRKIKLEDVLMPVSSTHLSIEAVANIRLLQLQESPIDSTPRKMGVFSYAGDSVQDTMEVYRVNYQRGGKTIPIFEKEMKEGSILEFYFKDTIDVPNYICFSVLNRASKGVQFLFFNLKNKRLYITPSHFNGFSVQPKSVNFKNKRIILTIDYPTKKSTLSIKVLKPQHIHLNDSIKTIETYIKRIRYERN